MNRLQENMVTSYNGDGDIVIWMKKLKLVAELQKIEDLSTMIPLYLEGSAFAVYDQMETEKQKSAAEVEAALMEAFEQNAYAAFDNLKVRSWTYPETVDSFLSDLRWLCKLSGVENDRLVRNFFICGLPTDVSNSLRASAQINSSSLAAVAAKARILMGDRVFGGGMAAVGAAVAGTVSRTGATVANKGRKPGKMQCWECGGEHPAKFCKDKKPVVCWKCGKDGHISRDCMEGGKPAGNGNGELHAPAATW